ncbi:uncharacterized protein LOC122017044 [Zingiber officinale]|uniref:DUF761 domain-containing protein n=1 Tax=Zingiber officinale TaxID=94328 RepID=A0A8J5F2X0_ZINOF|nr:uncharacterized protein LOC122017044 [Zingiber officinale]KAG6480610.1 hypothetical protein ZIOFF_057194 [Zingiber officinale]
MAAANSTNNNMLHVVNAESNSEGSRDSRRVATNSTRDDAVAGFARGGGAGGERIQRRQVASARRAEYVEVENINEEADAFIRRFRQQLHLQRLQSIENYNQMLARGL